MDASESNLAKPSLRQLQEESRNSAIKSPVSGGRVIGQKGEQTRTGSGVKMYVPQSFYPMPSRAWFPICRPEAPTLDGIPSNPEFRCSGGGWDAVTGGILGMRGLGSYVDPASGAYPSPFSCGSYGRSVYSVLLHLQWRHVR